METHHVNVTNSLRDTQYKENLNQTVLNKNLSLNRTPCDASYAKQFESHSAVVKALSM